MREAARAINDERIEAASGLLAELKLPSTPDPSLISRVAHANFRLGTATGATRLAALAVGRNLGPELRLEAVGALGDWARPVKRDRVTGSWRPLPTTSEARDARVAADALAPRLPRLLARSTPEPLRLAAIEATEQLGLTRAAGRLRPLAVDRKSSPALRLRALQALAALQAPGLGALARRAGSIPTRRCGSGPCGSR